jgi:hypothetical protein
MKTAIFCDVKYKFISILEEQIASIFMVKDTSWKLKQEANNNLISTVACFLYITCLAYCLH